MCNRTELLKAKSNTEFGFINAKLEWHPAETGPSEDMESAEVVIKIPSDLFQRILSRMY